MGRRIEESEGGNFEKVMVDSPRTCENCLSIHCFQQQTYVHMRKLLSFINLLRNPTDWQLVSLGSKKRLYLCLYAAANQNIAYAGLGSLLLRKISYLLWQNGEISSILNKTHPQY